MRSYKKLAVLVAVFALSAIGAANASASTFTASATGSLTGLATSTHVFTVNGGTVKCATAATSGTIGSTASTSQEVTVHYTGCTAFGFVNTDITDATYEFTSNGTVHIKNTITITPTGAACDVTVHPQEALGTITYKNLAGGKLAVEPNVRNIVYTTTAGLCGSAGSAGTYTGNSEIERVGGGFFSWDA